ncbi:haloalkane dehalogenase [Pavlovales sp. CCMP2436]|nr:haloalkane dehalogenase [Pavlovales sp. CCMP2436]
MCSARRCVEEGVGEPILFLHGNPMSCYLWRNIIPHVAKVGRAITIDLIGMGKSDKPDISYSYDDQYEFLVAFIEALQLKKVTLVIHDWGSALGFRYAHAHEGNVRGIAFMEALVRTVAFTGPDSVPFVSRLQFGLMRGPLNWLLVAKGNMFLKKVLPDQVIRKLTKEETLAYHAPFPTAKDRKPIARFPREIPIDGFPAKNHTTMTAYALWLTQTQMPTLFLKCSPGMIINDAISKYIETNLKNLTTVDLGEGRHFVQEDKPDEIGEAIVAWIRNKQILSSR